MRLLAKLGLIVLLVYITIGLILHEFRINQYNYYYHQPNWLKLAASILLQPVVDLWFNRKTTYFFDWQTVAYTDLDQSVLPLTLRSTAPKFSSYNHALSLTNLQTTLSFSQESAIIAPVDNEDYWSLVFCSRIEEVCQRNNLFHKGPIKILLDGEVDFWGISPEGKNLRLKVLEYTSVNNRKEILFI